MWPQQGFVSQQPVFPQSQPVYPPQQMQQQQPMYAPQQPGYAPTFFQAPGAYYGGNSQMSQPYGQPASSFAPSSSSFVPPVVKVAPKANPLDAMFGRKKEAPLAAPIVAAPIVAAPVSSDADFGGFQAASSEAAPSFFGPFSSASAVTGAPRSAPAPIVVAQTVVAPTQAPFEPVFGAFASAAPSLQSATDPAPPVSVPAAASIAAVPASAPVVAPVSGASSSPIPVVELAPVQPPKPSLDDLISKSFQSAFSVGPVAPKSAPTAPSKPNVVVSVPQEKKVASSSSSNVDWNSYRSMLTVKPVAKQEEVAFGDFAAAATEATTFGDFAKFEGATKQDVVPIADSFDDFAFSATNKKEVQGPVTAVKEGVVVLDKFAAVKTGIRELAPTARLGDEGTKEAPVDVQFGDFASVNSSASFGDFASANSSASFGDFAPADSSTSFGDFASAPTAGDAPVTFVNFKDAEDIAKPVQLSLAPPPAPVAPVPIASAEELFARSAAAFSSDFSKVMEGRRKEEARKEDKKGDFEEIKKPSEVFTDFHQSSFATFEAPSAFAAFPEQVAPPPARSPPSARPVLQFGAFEAAQQQEAKALAPTTTKRSLSDLIVVLVDNVRFEDAARVFWHVRARGEVDDAKAAYKDAKDRDDLEVALKIKKQITALEAKILSDDAIRGIEARADTAADFALADCAHMPEMGLYSLKALQELGRRDAGAAWELLQEGQNLARNLAAAASVAASSVSASRSAMWQSVVELAARELASASAVVASAKARGIERMFVADPRVVGHGKALGRLLLVALRCLSARRQFDKSESVSVDEEKLLREWRNLASQTGWSSEPVPKASVGVFSEPKCWVCWNFIGPLDTVACLHSPDCPCHVACANLMANRFPDCKEM